MNLLAGSNRLLKSRPTSLMTSPLGRTLLLLSASRCGTLLVHPTRSLLGVSPRGARGRQAVANDCNDVEGPSTPPLPAMPPLSPHSPTAKALVDAAKAAWLAKQQLTTSGKTAISLTPAATLPQDATKPARRATQGTPTEGTPAARLLMDAAKAAWIAKMQVRTVSQPPAANKLVDAAKAAWMAKQQISAGGKKSLVAPLSTPAAPEAQSATDAVMNEVEAPDAVRTELAEGWISAVDPNSGYTYYVHEASGAAQWEPPVWLAEGWTSAVDPNSGYTYYLHVASGTAQWEPPQLQAASVPQASAFEAIPVTIPSPAAVRPPVAPPAATVTEDAAKAAWLAKQETQTLGKATPVAPAAAVPRVAPPQPAAPPPPLAPRPAATVSEDGAKAAWFATLDVAAAPPAVPPSPLPAPASVPEAPPAATVLEDTGKAAWLATQETPTLGAGLPVEPDELGAAAAAAVEKAAAEKAAAVLAASVAAEAEALAVAAEAERAAAMLAYARAQQALQELQAAGSGRVVAGAPPALPQISPQVAQPVRKEATPPLVTESVLPAGVQNVLMAAHLQVPLHARKLVPSCRAAATL